MLPSHLKDAIHHYIPAMGGMTSPERCCEMAELVYDTKPSVVVDIGAFGGVTLVSQAFSLRELAKGRIYGIDAYKASCAAEDENEINKAWWHKINFKSVYLSCAWAIWDHHLEDHAVLIRSRSEDCYQLFERIDILNIDGCHSEAASVRDVQNYLPRVVAGGWIWMDDCDWFADRPASTQAAQRLLEESCDIVRSGDNGHYKLYHKR